MESAGELTARVERLIRTEHLISPGDGVVVAVSGGPDSVALLHLLFALSGRYRWRLTVAHVNHGFRGEESEREAAIVVGLAQELRLPCESVDIDVPRHIRETGKNAQVAARELRYAFLTEVAERSSASRIALAHHADDQAETALMRFIRGTGPSGLAGMPMRRMVKNGLELIRPLLRIYKSDLVDYCHRHRLPYCTDSSNLENKYFRNQMRNVALPFLRQYNEQLSSSLLHLTEMAAAENDYMERETSEIFKQMVKRDGGIYTWSAKSFAGVHVALQRRLIKLILNYLASDPDGIDFVTVEGARLAIAAKEPSNFRREIGQNITIVREYDRIAVHTMVLQPVAYAYAVERGSETIVIPETGVMLEFRWLDGEISPARGAAPYEAWFDADELDFPLSVRSRKPGDRMKPYGLNGTKKVKDMYIDAKIPPLLRERIPIVEDAKGTVLWLPGVRRSAHAGCGAKTVHYLHMKLHMPESPLFSMSR
ncbi:tRNA(Ile)-lysidine synthase [Paenibacillus allorhizosphaerae]|uniref:tRNA(Ile)-lysidine synthase n=2 Tax=Paenibacillus allorhizosphaerae TaxID=2849866 RepID=A0ABM8VS86_9BACL|nr:tRNA lysidine(34) synthetase TilS [Paenibacillus allorhizosphaerae]CAG7656372.1 tRNA(Ile)-lysidine synthase [Paenibacillus allorhizosphaerae]